MSILTSIGIIYPTRTLQGGPDTETYFHDNTRQWFTRRIENLIHWIYEYLILDETDVGLLYSLDIFLTVYDEAEFLVHENKSHFFLRVARYCSRILSEHGVKFYTRNLSSILDMPKPKTAVQFQQLVCTEKWMPTAIPEFNKLTEPLRASLEEASKSPENGQRNLFRKSV